MIRSSSLRFAAIGVGVLFCAGSLPLRAAESDAPDSVVVDPPTEAVINGALHYLAAQQQANGSWTAAGGRGDHPVAITGYVLLAFMAAGNLPEEGDYARQVNAGMQFLLDSLQPDGTYRGVNAGQYMYNHGIATIALAELYGQTRSPAIRTKLERAVKLIVTTQSDRGDSKGGWRYRPFPGDADISITVMQVVALRAAKNGGFNVPQQTIDDAIDYVRRCKSGGAGGFSYQAGRGEAGFARTAAAIYSLQVCGQYNDPLVQGGSDYLFEKNRAGGQWWSYGCNYATPAQYMIGGGTWKRWYGLMKDALLGSVRREGDQCHWEGEVGPVYCTATHATILAMPWHYIPLYQR
ncbi:MAG: terpene cyclase/mutase family protein [Chthoniobacter sp.]|nr:terpene cyclase/mutase family protein [Chthoniobacter sp.]